jgi:hypothetical protein
MLLVLLSRTRESCVLICAGCVSSAGLTGLEDARMAAQGPISMAARVGLAWQHSVEMTRVTCCGVCRPCVGLETVFRAAHRL